MARRKYNLLEVAIADLRQASFSLRYGTDELDIDMAAYHCSQCVEKVAKYLIKLQGDTCVPSHTTDMYLPDLKNEEARTLIEQIATKVDSWNNQIRYEHTQLASAKAVLR